MAFSAQPCLTILVLPAPVTTAPAGVAVSHAVAAVHVGIRSAGAR